MRKRKVVDRTKKGPGSGAEKSIIERYEEAIGNIRRSALPESCWRALERLGPLRLYKLSRQDKAQFKDLNKRGLTRRNDDSVITLEDWRQFQWRLEAGRILLQPELDRIRAGERMTAADYAITINAR